MFSLLLLNSEMIDIVDPLSQVWMWPVSLFVVLVLHTLVLGPSLSRLTLWVPWFACFCQPIIDLAATLTIWMEMHRSGCFLTVLFPFSLLFSQQYVPGYFFSSLSLPPSFRSASSPFCVLFSVLHASFFSLKWRLKTSKSLKELPVTKAACSTAM